MKLYDELFTLLSGTPAITGYTSTRIFPMYLPQGAAYPAIRIDSDNNGGMVDLDGQGDTLEADVQIDCLADTLNDALAIASEVRTVLKGFTGLMGATRIFTCTLNSEFETYEPAIGEGKFRATQTWTFWHN